MAAIRTENLAKTFHLRSRSAATEVSAVRGISFAIGSGERVAFIGPNGAGKSTTLKMLTGILEPSAGAAEVAGFVPWRQRRALARRIGIVFGQRSQLWHQLPVGDSFDLLAKIYSVAPARHVATRARLVDIFSLGELIARPVSSLSLGQRLRCEIAAALLHEPEILFLDEPTIGLDITAKAALRDHLNSLARESGTTILLTSHDTGDIERISERVIVIDQGRLLLDSPLERLRRDYLRERLVSFVTAEEQPVLTLAGARVAAREPHRLTLAIDTGVVAVERVVAAALAAFAVRDLTIEDPPLEAVISRIYSDAARAAS